MGPGIKEKAMNRIDEIRERERKATKGPWATDSIEDRVYLDEDHCIDCDCSSDSHVQDCDNATFIANAREDIPFLLEEVERLQQRLDAAETALEKLEWQALTYPCCYNGDTKGHEPGCEIGAWRKLKEQSDA